MEEEDIGPLVEDPGGCERKGVEKIKYRLRDISALPTRKIHEALKAATGRRVAMSAAAYAASATEYLVSEVCELAGDRRREIVREQGGADAEKVVTEGDVYSVLRGDEELNELTKNVLKPYWKR